MSKNSTTAGRGTDRNSIIPPIEIGSFVALRPDQSKFIGSASGAFFANTVFRAFASIASSQDASTEPTRETNNSAAADPGSAHSYLAAAENVPEDAADDALFDLIGQQEPAPEGSLTYGVPCPKLGTPPPAAVARKLLMIYFRQWHPFFPFLHGPTFFEQVNRFYDNNATGRDEPAPLRQSQKLAQAITFQAVFNIADSIHHGQKELEPQSRIQSPTALTNLLGIVSMSSDIASLQALLAVELYLITIMSLRSASTVHGTLTRIMYHSGLHRCPSRYVQLPKHVCEIRQRIFWSAYVLDRYLSQALGHPVAIADGEVDVCIPGMAELHNPVRPRAPEHPTLGTAETEIDAHMPRNNSISREQTGYPTVVPDVSDGTGTNQVRAVEIESPAHHHTGSVEAAGEYVLSYLITYSRLVGSALDLFHKSIHSRSITWEKVMEITYRVHSWWNSLPAALQETSDSEGADKHAQYGQYFAILYHYLILFVNRPFLSLPTHRTDFHSSIQASLGAARSIMTTLKSPHRDSIVFAWPGTLTATWMAGLVVSFAGLLGLYPIEKARLDLVQCMSILHSMNPAWNSARHCQAGLKSLLDKLSFLASSGPSNPLQLSNFGGYRESSIPNSSNTAEQLQSGGERSRKRRYADMLPPPVSQPATDFQWQPILEYLGPDFGFDAIRSHNGTEWPGSFTQNLSSDSAGLLFGDVGWDSYVQNIETHLNF